jgi:oligoribonuclease NrnB/cAMP/cGMP phosphodiesterase (DHH superfamily)
LVLITDLSVNEEVASLIDFVNEARIKEGLSDKFILLDHHATASWLNKYSWANVTPVKVIEGGAGYVDGEGWVADTIKTAGTSMLYDYAIKNGHLDETDTYTYYNIYYFAEQVRRWDTWDWHNVFKSERPKRLNSLLYLIGREKFVERFSQNLDLSFTEGEELVVSIEEARIKNYIGKVSKNIIPITVEGYSVGAVFAEQYQSELGNALAEQNPQFDFIAILNVGGKGISLRGVKDEIDLGKIAEIYGGGGHPKAAGASMNAKIVENLASVVFDKNVLAFLKAQEGENNE